MGVLFGAVAPAFAEDPVLNAASYPDMTTYNCHTDPIPIYPGQNLNLYGLTKTCPNAERVSGPGDAERLRRGLDRRGLRHPLQAEHGRDPSRTAR